MPETLTLCKYWQYKGQVLILFIEYKMSACGIYNGTLCLRVLV